MQQKQEDRLDKQNREQDASINQMQPISDMKLDKVRHDMFAISNKLKEQRLVWQNRLAQLDSLTKNHLSKEQVLVNGIRMLKVHGELIYMLQLWRIIILRNARAIVMLDVIPMPTEATQSRRGNHLRPKL